MGDTFETPTVTVPGWMQDNFRRGLVHHDEGKSGQVTPQTVGEARQAVNSGTLPSTKPVRMAAWFARHMGSLDGAPSPGDDGYPTAGQVSHMLWGGGASRSVSQRAQAWAERQAARVEREASVVSVLLDAEPGEGVLPDGYRPAAGDDVPEGRACANCVHYDETETRETGDGDVEVWCGLWAAFVRGDFYCDRWESVDGEPTPEGEDEVMADVTDTVVDLDTDDEDKDKPGYGLPSRALVIVATEGEQTADGRIADVGGLTWRTPPLSLTVNHDPNQRVGRLDRLARVQSVDGLTIDDVDDMEGDGEGPVIVATATLNLDTVLGREVAGEIRDGFLTGVSMEVGDEVVEYDENDVMHLVEARIGAVSVVVFQAIETARVVEVASAHRWMLSQFPFESESLVAAGVLDVPPAVWFTDPGLTEPTGMVVTDAGQVYGHLAVWGTCHTGKPDGVCVTPPESPSGYAYFATGYVKADTGDGTVDVPVGVITMNTGHASVAPNVSAQAAAAHYDHTGTGVADVTVGEDMHGIWFAGALRPGVTPEQVRELRASALSGDWRSIRGSLELVAALAVNVPGFPVPRVQAGLAASGEQVSLVAAGAAVETDCGCDDTGLDDRVARLERTVAVLARYTGAVERLAARIK